MAGMREILWEAWNSKHGIEVSISDETIFRARFYAERAKARAEGISEFDVLQLISPPPDKINMLWIVTNHAGQESSPEEGQISIEEDPSL